MAHQGQKTKKGDAQGSVLDRRPEGSGSRSRLEVDRRPRVVDQMVTEQTTVWDFEGMSSTFYPIRSWEKGQTHKHQRMKQGSQQQV